MCAICITSLAYSQLWGVVNSTPTEWILILVASFFSFTIYRIWCLIQSWEFHCWSWLPKAKYDVAKHHHKNPLFFFFAFRDAIWTKLKSSLKWSTKFNGVMATYLQVRFFPICAATTVHLPFHAHLINKHQLTGLVYKGVQCLKENRKLKCEKGWSILHMLLT